MLSITNASIDQCLFMVIGCILVTSFYIDIPDIHIIEYLALYIYLCMIIIYKYHVWLLKSKTFNFFRACNLIFFVTHYKTNNPTFFKNS